MRYLFILFLCFYSFVSVAQVDTIYTGRDKIACTIKEVTPEAIQYVYPGESLINTVYKNTVQKIVFRSGRTQTFSESISLAQVNRIEDYGKVTITQMEGETKGLYKVGEVSASARGGSVYSNVDRVKERALNKLKMETVMRGGNLVYMAYQKTDGNKYGGYFQSSHVAETVYTGVAYANILPNKEDFMHKIAGIDLLTSTSQIILLKGTAISKSEYSIEASSVDIRIAKTYEEAGQVYLGATIRGFDTNAFRVVRYDNSTFTLLAENKNKVVNLIVPFSK